MNKITTARSEVAEPLVALTKLVASGLAILQLEDTRAKAGKLVVDTSKATISQATSRAISQAEGTGGDTALLRLALKPMLMLSGTAAGVVAGVASADGAGAAAVAGEAMAVGVVGAAGGEHHD